MDGNRLSYEQTDELNNSGIEIASTARLVHLSEVRLVHGKEHKKEHEDFAMFPFRMPVSSLKILLAAFVEFGSSKCLKFEFLETKRVMANHHRLFNELSAGIPICHWKVQNKAKIEKKKKLSRPDSNYSLTLAAASSDSLTAFKDFGNVWDDRLDVEDKVQTFNPT
ncbi:hypothetical protein DUI87_10698 [Hirundo rustica rustica]|uniref:Uncharacterized protein n=1 Tax=Hirundo rustica rustica TaxID=333673 RepID=A0A3M0KJE2_HIRRU|nr:hypothetical protein DUI87_10698 [Hirundo rustica rustica]